MKDYWNNTYWKKNIEQNKLDFVDDIWLDKYDEILKRIPKKKALDLGCGVGQYTSYLLDKGFNVTSADISLKALNEVKKINHQTITLDMSKPLPFKDNTFTLVFANLSIHYFDNKTTINLLNEIRRILKEDGYFIGTVNSLKTLKLIDNPIEIESHFYNDNGVLVRLWDKQQFDYYFKDFDLKVLEEVETIRRNRPKIMWEFIAKNK